MRLDVYLHLNNYAKSRSNASNLIKLGKVSVNGEIINKTSYEIIDDKSYIIKIDNKDDFASLGGVKLKQALDFWDIDCMGKIALDVGASNGGFTDLLLKRGAKMVYAVDVGECALSQTLKNDKKVIIKDKLNARYMPYISIGEKCDIITVDVSFISLKLVLPNLIQFMHDTTQTIALIKPQFEAGKAALDKKGIVKDKKTYDQVISDIESFVISQGLIHHGTIKAPHEPESKNQEYLINLTKKQFTIE